MIIHHHLGLGDHFVCNGIVNYFSQNNKIDLICKKHNFVTIESLYSENNNVHIVPISGQNELIESYKYSQQTNQQILYIGFDKCNINNWDKSFYEQINLDFAERYRLFKLPNKLPKQLQSNNKNFILIHNQSSDKAFTLNIRSSLAQFIVEKKHSNNLLSYLDLIKSAKEIHCIDSSFFHLVDSIPQITNKLYYHNIRKSITSFEISNKWHIVNYN